MRKEDRAAELKPKYSLRKGLIVKAGEGFLSAHLLKESTGECSEQGLIELRSRLRRDGYLFLKAFLPKKEVTEVSKPTPTSLPLNLRSQMLKVLHNVI